MQYNNNSNYFSVGFDINVEDVLGFMVRTGEVTG